MSHKIPAHTANRYTISISDTKRTQVSNLQNHIQEILGDTHHTFLQGSYKNDTSISDINDVDVVAVRLTTYSGVHSQVRFPSSISWDAIFTEIEHKLRNQRLYTWTVTRKDKCIEVRTSSFKADVVPAVQINQNHLEDPIAIYSFNNDHEKINYPRTHWRNGVAKHASTNSNYKPTVRMFKNWNAAHFDGLDVVSSYHVESLVYGAPDNLFNNDPVTSFILVSNHIVKALAQRDVMPVIIHSVCGSEDITANWDFGSRQLFKTTLGNAHSTALAAYNAGTIQDSERYWDLTFNIR